MRMLLAPVCKKGSKKSHTWIMLTPHWDVYSEDVREYRLFVVLGPRGGLPQAYSVGPRSEKLVRFDLDQLRDERAEWLRKGAELAAAEYAEASSDDELVEADDDGKAPPARHVWPPAGSALVAMESRFGFVAGQAVSQDQEYSFVGRGSRGVCKCPLGEVAVAVVGTYQVAEADDLRTLPVQTTKTGKKHRDYTSAVELCSETPFPDWCIEGPRTALWVLEAIQRQETTPVRRHYWWRQMLQVTVADEGISEHLAICEALETAVTFDQLNCGELAIVEQMARRLQMWEHVYAQRLQDTSRPAEGSSSKGVDGDERALFSGNTDRAMGVSLVCPQLQEWIATQMRERSSVLKERRKAREERDGDDGAPKRNNRRGGGKGGQPKPKAEGG